MESRYSNAGIKNTSIGRKVYMANKYPTIPLRNTDIYVATETGDRFDSLATQFYRDPSLWWIIASANNIHDGSMGVDDGTVLRIPVQYLEIINDFNNR
jgi:hypothetical protein